MVPDIVTDFDFMKKATRLYGENFKLSKIFDFFKKHDEDKLKED